MTTIAVSSPLSIPMIRPEFGLNYTLPPSTAAATSPTGGVRRAVSQGQQFGRYQDNENDTAVRNTSSMSLEALAALLSEDNSFVIQSSPPGTTSSIAAGLPKLLQYKSRSFPTIKPPSQHYSSSGHHRARPPVRKTRSVKFADSKGLPLASVRNLTAADPFETEGGIVPQLFNDLGAIKLKKPLATSLTQEPSMKVSFPQPGTQPEFITKLRIQQVCLESAYIPQSRQITGIVRVMNIAYDKDVTVRWTNNKWTTFTDTQCTYCQHTGSSDTTTDRFTFTLPATSNRQDIEFAVRYKVLNNEYWDSNDGHNYLISSLH